MTRNSNHLQFGDYVLLSDDREGYIRYIGERAHNHGIWYGIELIIGAGSNNGTEDGEIYFVCRPGRGIFARSWNIKQVLSNNRTRSRSHKKHKKRRRKPPKSPSKSPRMHPKSPSRSPGIHATKSPSKSPRMRPKPPSKSPRMHPKSPSKSPRIKPSKRNHANTGMQHDELRSKSYANVERQRYHKAPHSVRREMTKALKGRNKPKYGNNIKIVRHGSAQIAPKHDASRKQKQHKRMNNNTNASQHIASRSMGLSVTDDINPVFDLAAILDPRLNDSEPLFHDDMQAKHAQKVMKKRKSKKFKPLPVKKRKKHKKRKKYGTDSDSSDSIPPLPRRKKSKSKSKLSQDNSLTPNAPSSRASKSSRSRSRGRKRKAVSNRKYSDSNSPPFVPQKRKSANWGQAHPMLVRHPESPDSPAGFSQFRSHTQRQTVSNRPQRFATPQPILKQKRNSAHLMRFASPQPPKRKSYSGLPSHPRQPPPPPHKAHKRKSNKAHHRFASPQPLKKKKKRKSHSKSKSKSKSKTRSMTPTGPKLSTHLRSATSHKSPALPPQIKLGASMSMSFSKSDRIHSPAHAYKKRDLTTNLEQLQKKHRVRAWSSDSLHYIPKKKGTQEDKRDGWNCGECARFNESEFKFCPNCGGKRPPLEAAQITDSKIDEMDLKQVSDCEEDAASENEDEEHSRSIRKLLKAEAPKSPQQTSIKVLNDITPKSPARHKRAQSEKRNVLNKNGNLTEELDRLNKDDFIKTFEEMKQEIGAQRANSVAKSKTPKGTGSKSKNGRFPFSFKKWILSPRAPKNSKGSKSTDTAAYDDNIEHSISNSDVSFAYSVGKGLGGYHVEGRITALGRYNQQKTDFIPDTPEFTPHQTPKIKGMEEFAFESPVAVALCQSPTPELDIEPMDSIRLEMEEDEKVKEKVDIKKKEKENKRKRKRKNKKKAIKRKGKNKKKKEKEVRKTYDMDGSESDSDISF